MEEIIKKIMDDFDDMLPSVKIDTNPIFWIESMVKILEGLKRKYYRGDGDRSLLKITNYGMCDACQYPEDWCRCSENLLIMEYNDNLDQAIQQLKTFIN